MAENQTRLALLTQNEYSEIGQLVDKKLHSTNNGGSFKQSIDYRYNIRGWMTNINNPSLANDGVTNDDANDLFGAQFGFNTGIGTGNTAQFNGNISAIKWSNHLGQADVKERAYNFTYDPMNRLLTSTHQEKSSTWSASAAGAYQEDNTYDANGNFLTITRRSAGGALMDNMAYTNVGNQTTTITDTGDKTKGFIDGNSTGNDFSYDANGNTTIDKNAGITTAITYNYLNLPERVVNAATGDYMRNVYDARGRKLNQSVYTSANTLKKSIDYAGEFFYQNDSLKFINHEEGRVVMTGATPEYQYYLKDHLGNNRVLFTATPGQDVSTATLETATATTEQSKFLRYANARRINATLFDHTRNGVSSYSQRLNGSANEKTGLAKSISVMPGDTIKMEVYAKYVDPNSTNWTAALATLIGQIASNTAGVVVDGASYATSGSSFPYSIGLNGTTGSSGTGPKAYMNWLIFDRNFVFKNGGFVRMSAAAKEQGQNVAHEKLTASFTINEPGYVYAYLSNEETANLEVYFDDWSINQSKSLLVEANDYYPYGGLMASSYVRESSLPNRWKYGNKELVTDLNLNLQDFGVRLRGDFDPRWRTIDPKAELGRRWSPYNYAFDNPMRFVDPDGMWPDIPRWLTSAFIRAGGDPEVQKNIAATKESASKVFIGTFKVKGEVGAGSSLDITAGPAKIKASANYVSMSAQTSTKDGGKLTLKSTLGEIKVEGAVKDTKLSGYVKGINAEVSYSKDKGLDGKANVADRGYSIEPGTKGLSLDENDFSAGGKVKLGKAVEVGGEVSFGQAFMTVVNAFNTVSSFSSAVVREVSSGNNMNQESKEGGSVPVTPFQF